MTNLSPGAQAVLKSACIHHGLFNEEIIQRRRMLAAALRAAADQVVPLALCVHNDDFVYVRHQLHAIATELEGAQ